MRLLIGCLTCHHPMISMALLIKKCVPFISLKKRKENQSRGMVTWNTSVMRMAFMPPIVE